MGYEFEIITHLNCGETREMLAPDAITMGGVRYIPESKPIPKHYALGQRVRLKREDRRGTIVCAADDGFIVVELDVAMDRFGFQGKYITVRQTSRTLQIPVNSTRLELLSW